MDKKTYDSPALLAITVLSMTLGDHGLYEASLKIGENTYETTVAQDKSTVDTWLRLEAAGDSPDCWCDWNLIDLISDESNPLDFGDVLATINAHAERLLRGAGYGTPYLAAGLTELLAESGVGA